MTTKLWGFHTGVLYAASIGHILRLVDLGSWGLESGRHVVAWTAILIYMVAALLSWSEKKLGLWISIIGPIGGVTAVTLIPGASVDTFQVTLGVMQFVGTIVGIWILVRLHQEKNK